MAAHHGVVVTQTIKRIGGDRTELARLVRAGDLVRLSRGAYADSRVWEESASHARYVLRCRAAALARPGSVLAGHAALAVLGLPLFGVDLRRIDLMAPVNSRFRRNGIVIAPLSVEAITGVEGLSVVAPAQAIVTVTTRSGLASGLVAADAAVHRGIVHLSDIERLSPPPRRPGHRRVARMLALVDQACESPGETRTRLLLHGLGWQVRSQVVLRRRGTFVARVDFLIEDTVVVEFDGR